MRADRAATLLCAGTLGRAGLIDAVAATPVLMYHSISHADERAVSPYYRLTTTPARFREHMTLLADSGYVATSLTRALEPTHRPRERQVVVTFDDGYVDFLTDAWPVLEAHSFTASVFLPTGYIGDSRRSFKGHECLTWPEVRDLSRAGVSFGSHTVTHPVLHTLSWAQIRGELRHSSEQIEQIVGKPVTTFSYPFAFPQNDRDFVSSFCDELRVARYRAGVTTAIGRIRPGDDPLQLPRLPINDADDVRLFAAKIAGAYDWLGGLQSAWKRARGRTHRPVLAR